MQPVPGCRQNSDEFTRARKACVFVLLYFCTSTFPPASSDELNLTVSLLPLTPQPEIVGPVYGFCGVVADSAALRPSEGYAIAIAAIAARCPTGFFNLGWMGPLWRT